MQVGIFLLQKSSGNLRSTAGSLPEYLFQKQGYSGSTIYLISVCSASSDDKGSYTYVEEDSWLYDYERKKILVNSVFDEFIAISYDPADIVKKFMNELGYKTRNT